LTTVATNVSAGVLCGVTNFFGIRVFYNRVRYQTFQSIRNSLGHQLEQGLYVVLQLLYMFLAPRQGFELCVRKPASVIDFLELGAEFL